MGALLGAAIGLAVFSVATALPASASSGVQLFNETFSNNTVPTSEVVLPNLPSGAAQSPPDESCLTANGTPSGASAVPQCSGAPDPNGSGFLRFTTSGTTQESGVFSATTVPSTQGLDITFNSYQFGGSGADGIAFALAIANPADPRPPAQIGESGGSLGYGASAGHNGLSLGYLGVGLDAFGNYSGTGPDGSDCAGQGHAGGSPTPDAVSVRGPGNGGDGYCLVGGPWTDGSSKLDSESSTAVPVEVAINPTGSPFTTASGLVVPASSFAAQWTPIGGTQQTETGDLPNLNQAKYSDLGIPSNYYNSSGIPYQMTFGWVASTGNSTDTHEVDNVVVDTGTSNAIPTLGLSASDNEGGEFGQGTSVGYTFTPSVSAADESGTITFTDPFPSGLTPTSTTGTDASWTCGIVTSTVTCTHAGVPSGTTMPDIDIAASVASNASTTADAMNDRGYVSANDALDADALDQGTAYGPSTATSLSPNNGSMAGGTQVAVTGTNFNNVSSVNVGSATVSTACGVNGPFSDCYTVNSLTSITLFTPTGTSAGGIGPRSLTVTNDAGTGSGSTYTYTKASSTTTVTSSQNPSVSGQAVSFTASLSSGATGTVTFAITPAVTCTGGNTVTVAASAATCVVPSGALSAAGSTYSVSANYSGDGNFFTSTGSLSPVQTVNEDPTTTSTPTSTVNPSVYGQSVTYATTVTATAPGTGVPTGVAAFQETVGGVTTAMCAGTLNESGETSCTTSVLPPAGIASVQANYLGDSNYLTSTSSGLVQFVNRASTSTVLSSNLNPSGFGKPVIFTATVGATAPGGGIPDGQVSFSSDGSPITGCSNVTLNGSAQATCTTSALSVAGHTVLAAYSGSANYLASSGSLTQTVGQEATTTTEVSSANPSVTGQSITISASVSSSGSGTPTGNVIFTIIPTSGLAPQCSGGNSVALNGSASAVCTLVLSSGASYQIQAEYNGDANFDASGSTELTQNVNVASTTTSVATSAANATTDQAITFTATVAPVSPGGGVPSDGTVTFDIGGTPVTACEGQTVTAGTATCTVANLDVAGGPTYSVTGFYSGAPDYSPSNNSGSPLIQTIAPAATSTSITSNTNPSTFGQSVIFTATVAPIAPGGGVPTGTATVSADGSTLCTGSLVSGQLTCTVGSLIAGTHQLTASYAASTDYGASTSSTLTQGVNQSSTTTTVTSSDNPSAFGENVTITATIAAVSPGQGTPTGLVDFSNGIVPICVNVPLSGGVATCSFNFVIGSYTIVAAYRGSAGFIQSTGQTVQVVQKAATTSTVVSAPTVVTGQGATYQASVSVSSPGSTSLGNITGTVSLYAVDTQDDAPVLLCSTAVTVSGATVSCPSSAAIGAGSPWAITAVYSGDTNFMTSTSSPVAQTVNLASTATGVSGVVSPSVTGQTITATAGYTITSPGSDSPVAPTGTVEFEISLDGGSTFNPVSGCSPEAASWSLATHSGTSTCSLPSPPAVSSVQLKAVYSGDSNFASSTSSPFILIVNEAATTTTISADNNPSVSGETVNYTATVVVAPPGSDSTPPTGTVGFGYSANDGDTWTDITGCTAQNLVWNSEIHSGTATCATAFDETSSGDEVRAVYSGDGNFDGSISSDPVTQVINAAETTASVVLSPTSVVSGQAVTATATVLITAPGSDTPSAPTGTVDFQDSSNSGGTWTDIPGCTTQVLAWNSVNHRGTSACATSFDAGSSPLEVQAVSSGDANFGLSTSPSATEDVADAGTTTAVVATPDVSVSGQEVALSATVLITPPGSDAPAGPSGTVDFQSSSDGGAVWNDIAGCSTQDLIWNSDTHSGASTCGTAFDAISSGVEIQAVYSGDINFTTSTSSAATQTVNLASTVSTISTVVNPSVTGQTITATAGLTVASPGSDSPVAPTGTVEFEISLNGGSTFSPVPDCGNQATLWDGGTDSGSSTCTLLSPPAVSSVQLEGIYSGDANFDTSTSPPATQVVNEASTSTSISANNNPSVSGETVTYTAAVAITPPGSDSTTPSGTVDFQFSTNSGDTWSNIADCSAEPLAWNSETHIGTSTCATAFSETSSGVEVQAVYSGDENFDGSTSAAPVTQVVNAGQTTTSVLVAPTSSVSGQSVTATATLLITEPGFDSPSSPTGTVDFQYSTNSGDTWSNIAGCSTQALAWNSGTHAGTSACTTSFGAGSSPVDVQAIYSGDSNFGLSTSPSATETVDEAATATSVSTNPNPSVSGETVDYTATVTVTPPGTDTPDPTGTVGFEYSLDGGSTWTDIAECSSQDLIWDSETHTGTSTCGSAFAATSSGVEIQAVYSGDSNFTTSTSSAVTQTVNLASTDTGVSAVVNPSVTGQTITVTAGLTIAAPGTQSPIAPTGTVEFEISLNGGSSFSPVTGCGTQAMSWDSENDAGVSTCSLVSPPAASSVELKGIYSGDSNFTTSTSPPVNQVVNEAATSTTVSVDNNPSVSGQIVNYTATVVVPPPGSDSTSPTGTVDFEYSTNSGDTWNTLSSCGTEPLVWSQVNHSGTSACAAGFATTSSGIKVRAVYSGDANFDGSTAVPLTQVVNSAPTTTSVVVAPTNTVSGQAVTATATLLISAPGSDGQATPTGTVDFEYSANDGDTWNAISGCTVQALTWNSVNHTGTASCSAKFDASSSPVAVRAVYSGDVNFSLSTSPGATETVAKASTTTSVIAAPGVSVSGQSVTLSASVSIASPGSDLPAGASGTVDFEYSTTGGDTWTAMSGCTVQTLTWNSTNHTGSATCVTSFAATSSGVELESVYSGDGSFTGSTSSPVTQTVSAAATITGIATSANPSVNGQTVTVEGTVSVVTPGGDTPSGPTGTVEFESSTDHGTNWAPVAACLTEALVWSDTAHNGTAGCDVQFEVSQSGIEFKAVYSGSSDYTTSVSDPVAQTVDKSLTSTGLTSAPNSSGPLQPVTFVAKVSAVAPGSGALSGTVTFTDGGVPLCTGSALIASGFASCTSHLSIAAAQSVVAVYSGNTVFSGSSGSMVQNVRHGYWLLGADGGVFSYGDAQFYGSLPQIGYTPAGSGGPHQLKAPLVGITSTVSGNGYWLVASDGGVFSFGDAVFYGSTGAMHLNKPIVAMAATPDGKGYWLIASDGGVFAFGDASFHGSTGAMHLNKPIVAMAATPDGKGYWLIASDGGVFGFGDALYHGSPSTGPIPEPIVGIARTADGGGYWIAASGGHVYSYGNAGAVTNAAPTDSPVVGIVGTADGKGYWMSTASGGVFTYGDAIFDGSAAGIGLQRPIVGISGL